MNIKLKIKAGDIVRYIFLFIVFVVTIFPLVWMVINSFKNRSEIFIGPLWPEKFMLDNYKFVIENLDIGKSFMNTTIVTAVSIFLILVVSVMAGYAFAKIKFPGRNAIFLALIASLTIPPQVTLIPLFLMLKEMSLLDSLTGLIASYTGLGVAFSIFLMRAFFVTIPDALRESAIIDGASEFTAFWKVVLPLAKPGIATVAIFQFVSIWNEFMYAATFILSPEKRTLQPTIRSLVGRYSTDWGSLCAGMVIAVIPILVTFIILQKQFIKGLTAGAIKG
ncbi:MAG TPA: carbohydrate ABC transporter permease [Candidatus Atribacteria bacterium]|nr:carbohydrate ABC transporter permease [Candidatus Atribacteria bacterium]